MYITAALTLVLLPTALTAPSNVGKRELPDHTPVTVEDFDSSFDTKCGKAKVAGTDIEKAVEWGTNLNDASQTLGSKKYPHIYQNHEAFKFPSGVCSSATNRLEFPVIKGGYFDGDDDAVGQVRAVFVHDPKGQPDGEGHPISSYCGTIYHPNQGDNDFAGCDVTK
ncbi:hypothetical protein VMCG_07534 [Cytospora schulzeri]|uniref:ribonuclease T1 n=1 Tax=Cytospora schulzeri TaxID=448051 RepID=A0A423W1D4_9PEZI|nr:hypothetical protein VMCG_07534 [Valsa malicola]